MDQIHHILPVTVIEMANIWAREDREPAKSLIDALAERGLGHSVANPAPKIEGEQIDLCLTIHFGLELFH